jgi:hypothetical protein
VRPYLGKPFTKKKWTGGVAQGVGLEFKSQYCKEKSFSKGSEAEMGIE